MYNHETDYLKFSNLCNDLLLFSFTEDMVPVVRASQDILSSQEKLKSGENQRKSGNFKVPKCKS